MFVYTVRDLADELLRVMRTGNVYQSGTYLGKRRMEPPFAYYRAFARGFDLVPDTKRLLMLGGGGFCFPKLVAVKHPEIHTDVVEIDPAVVKAAHRWFFLDEAQKLQRDAGGELCVVVDDARHFLSQAPAQSYDLVVSDVYVGAEPVRALATVEAAQAVRCVLRPSGVFLANVVSRDEGMDVSFLQGFVASLREVFEQVYICAATDEVQAEEDNYLVVASDTPCDLPDAIAYDEDFLGIPLFDSK